MPGLQRINILVKSLKKLIRDNRFYINRVTFDSMRKKSRNYSCLELQVLAKHQNKLELLLLEFIKEIGELEDVY